jgi:hypothetical protein
MEGSSHVTIADRSNADARLAELPMHLDDPRQIGAVAPTMATPGAFAAGLAAAGGAAAAAAAGAAIGEAVD